jgi:hypothetical protein
MHALERVSEYFARPRIWSLWLVLDEYLRPTGTSASQAASAMLPAITSHITSPRGSAGIRRKTDPVVIQVSRRVDFSPARRTPREPTKEERARSAAAVKRFGAAADRAVRYAFFANGTGIPAILALNEPRLVRVQKYTVFQSSPPNATLAVLAKPCTMHPSFLPFAAIT